MNTCYKCGHSIGRHHKGGCYAVVGQTLTMRDLCPCKEEPENLEACASLKHAVEKFIKTIKKETNEI